MDLVLELRRLKTVAVFFGRIGSSFGHKTVFFGHTSAGFIQDLEGSGLDGNSGFRPVLPRGPPVRTVILSECFLCVSAEQQLILMPVLSLRVSRDPRTARTTGRCTDLH